VKVHVLDEEIGSLKVLSALFAIEFLLFFVLNYMPVKVGRLVETLTTAWDRTDERAFTGVYAKVVKEVAPLPEKLTTTIEVTLHDPDEALRDRVPELEDAEVLCLWDGLVDVVNFITEILIEAM